MKKQYTVRQGDTLWGVAQRTLGDGQRDREIAALNKGQVRDPGEIQPGWVLDMPPDAHGPGVQTVPAGSGNGTGGGGSTVGGDHVMVDLQRADAAASALEGLRDALAQHVPAILTAISNLRGEGATLPPPTALQQLQGRSAQDAAEMRAAFRIAQAMNNALLAQQPPIVVTGKLDIGASWTPQSLDSAAAEADAQALLAAGTSKDKTAARNAILGVSQDLADHQGDTSYLTAFWSQNGTLKATANLAGLLNRQDGRGATVLSAQDQQILATFGNSLAATAKAERLGPTAYQRLADAFAKAPDLWSASMVFKYGPSGAAYGTGQGANLLAAVTRSVFNAREHGRYTIPLNTGQLRDGPYDRSVMPALQAYDPLKVMLQRAAENKAAATQVLGGPGGAGYAHDLLSTPYARYLDDSFYGGGFQSESPDPNSGPYGPDVRTLLLDQQTVANFLDAATQDPADPRQSPPGGTGEMARLSAQAALNIIQNTPDPSQISVSEPVRRALMDTYGRYMPDIAASVNGQYTGTSGQVVRGNDGSWFFELPVNSPAVPTFVQQIETNQKDAAMLQAQTLYSFGQAFGWQVKTGPSPGPTSDLAGDLAALYAEDDSQLKNLGYSQAQALDTRNHVFDNLLQMAPLVLVPIAPLGATSVAGKAAELALRVRFATTPWVADTFSTNNAARFAGIAENDAALKQDLLGTSMIQGLVNNGVIAPPPGADWYADGNGKPARPPRGKVLPTANLQAWWNQNKGYPVSQLPVLPGQPKDAKPLPPNPDNPYLAQTLENLWGQYGSRMRLTNDLTGSWDTGAQSGTGSASAG